MNSDYWCDDCCGNNYGNECMKMIMVIIVEIIMITENE